MPPTPQALDVHVYNRFVDEFHQETDRAAAILAGSYLDAFLEEALRCVLVQGKHCDALFQSQGCLASLSSKISLAAAMGLASPEIARDLDLIRKVRNHFAHHLLEASFEQPPVTHWCKELGALERIRSASRGENNQRKHPSRILYLLTLGFTTMQMTMSPQLPNDFRIRMTAIK